MITRSPSTPLRWQTGGEKSAALASAGEAGTATDSEAGVAEGEHATAESGDAQDPQVQP